MADILTKIVAKKRLEVQERCEATPIQVLKEVIRDQPKPRGFVEVLRNRMGNKQAAIIAEIKKASPSKGVIREMCACGLIWVRSRRPRFELRGS